MNKLIKRFIVLIAILISNGLHGQQSAYYDAIFIYENCFDKDDGVFKNRTTLFDVLKKYYRGEDLSENKLKNNPFFKPYVPVSIAQAVTKSTFIDKGLASIGGLDVTSIADGLARFLIKRGREELNIAFFQRMKKFLEEKVETKTLFPATSVFLGNIASYRYAELLQSLREAFHKDLKNLIINLNLLIDLPKYKELLKALPEVRVAIRSAKIVSELSQAGSSIHPANLIHRLAYLNEWHEMDINLENSWKLLDIISESVRKRNFEISTTVMMKDSLTLKMQKLTRDSSIADTVLRTKNQYEIKTITIPKGTLIIDSIRKEVAIFKIDTTHNNEIAWVKYIDFHDNILQNAITLKIFLGLLYERVENISFRIKDSTTQVQHFMENHIDDVFAIADLVENFLLLANDVEQSVKEFREKQEKSFTNDDYYSYIERAINMVEYGFKIANTIKPEITADRYIVMARNANNLYKNIYTKNYNAAVMNGYLILEEVLSKSKEAVWDKKHFLDSTNSSAIKDSFIISNSRLESAQFFEQENERLRTVERILKYGNVMAGIIKSQTPEEAESAIEAAALPAGSSSIKKNSEWNISLNAFIGGYYAGYTNDIDKIDGSNSKIGLTAPVGIAFSKGLGHFKNGSAIGSLSAYLTLIDVGGIAGYRLSNDSTALEQKITLDNIFTPGGFLVYGIGLSFLEYVPLSIGYGWQYGSKLFFKKQTGTLAVSDKSRFRSNWFIAIDIPLANFWTENLKNKR